MIDDPVYVLIGIVGVIAVMTGAFFFVSWLLKDDPPVDVI